MTRSLASNLYLVLLIGFPTIFPALDYYKLRQMWTSDGDAEHLAVYPNTPNAPTTVRIDDNRRLYAPGVLKEEENVRTTRLRISE